MNFRKFKKNAKALSPVIASIILIAVTVAVSVVVAAWMGGLTLGFMNSAEQASITNAVVVSNTNTNGVINATVQNTGTNSVTISSATIDGNSVILAPTGGTTAAPVTSFVVAKGTSGYFTLTTTAAEGNFTDGAQYTINLLTAKGHTLTYSVTYSPTPSL
jgi:flagellin-like protein